MPHVTIKHFAPGLSDDRKRRLADAISAVIVEHFATYEGAVSIALQPVDPAAWQDEVFAPEIAAHPARLIKAPHYEEETPR